jgi:SAM-dependent MidA family methyltransferase
MKQNSKPLDSFSISEQAKEIHDRLFAKIQSNILKQDGKIPFSQFMQMALYEPGLGYYQNNLHKFGEKGDFITAPEMGSNFAKCLARSVRQFFLDSSPADPNSSKTATVLLEIGAGSGILAVNLLTELEQLDALPAQYLILEPSAQLQNLQKSLLKKRLPNYFSNIKWISQLPEKLQGLILANEVVDAIPCERVKRVDGQWLQLGVSYDEGEFIDCLMPMTDGDDLPSWLSNKDAENSYQDGYTTEYRPLIKGWVKALSNTLDSGAILLIDYGYSVSEFYHPQRVQGSLSCFISHHSHSEPLQYVGLQDITAHVDFSQIARTAYENALEISGYTTQAGFLLENGITEISDERAEHETPEQRYQSSQELQTLLMPGQMGEVIKVILLSKGLNVEIKGFTLQDHLHRL